ncbi:hypothetical protein M231_02289 [Tremella mesenterica]|uniref:BHLH domain-containing protein n=1 Tax=Tremella mesenterica TaxID=5217 RepID=A0A4Q1BR64_TREME|nr:uncharacterized protein TREMEDRAFT_74726 [Tremella mesenterica DSM 1558]EIW66531.1 hypothetical protein TREMEDRAFT_74726 [Tremella mesenterica DSM 1558]RXK40456.1 hypothetical protein M231_02289 [Tremella mesenterica]
MTTLSPFSGSPNSVKNDITNSPQLTQTTTQSNIKSSVPSNTSKSKPRKRVNTAEKRNQHNAIERARRETLNGKFHSLARLLPALASSRRPSKAAIVNGSINHLTRSRDDRLFAAKILRAVIAERDQLLAENNTFRKAAGCPPREASDHMHEMERICAVEDEVFGTFPSFDADGEGEDDDEMSSSGVEQPSTATFHPATGNGLVTPRPSSDFDVSINQANPQNMFNVSMTSTAPRQPQTTNVTATATINGMNWSQEFAYDMAATAATGTGTGMNFSTGFMTDSVERASSGSPTTSQQGIYTPPATVPSNEVMYGPSMTTPSPRSTSQVEEKVVQTPMVAQAQQWSTTNMLLQQYQQAQRQAQMNSQAQLQVQPQLQPRQIQTPNMGQVYGGLMFPHSTQSTAYTEQFLDSLLSQTVQEQGQVEMWRQSSVGNVQPTVGDIKNAVRTGMDLGMNMATMWQDQAVEGFC